MTSNSVGPHSAGVREVDDVLTQLMREDGGRVIAILARQFGDLDIADEAVQDALLQATKTWKTGIPQNPPAWLMTVARTKAIDRIRRADSAHRRLMAAAPELLGDIESSTASDSEGEPEMIIDDAEIGDEQLRLALLCCHPALDRDAQIALTLRLVGGLTTAEIAAAFLTPTATLAQRIVRAKRKIRDARMPLVIPKALDERVAALLGVLYLIFNEGYLSRSGYEGATVRVDLAAEAIRLTRLTHDLLPLEAEVEGLLALELFAHSRIDARVDASGDLVLLESQDRTLWNRDRIAEANAALARALQKMQPGPYQLQALIAAQHANAPSADATDWNAIERYYSQLTSMTASPVVALNHAVAMSMTKGPGTALQQLDQLDSLADYYLLHSTRGEMLLRLGDAAAAASAFARSLALTQNPAEQRHLSRRLAVAVAAR